ncbi:hypothetical protein BGX21_004409 [Mortierella sp. AD011]|nr:hypothetical protein BGX21_004409 [Mortierella sp. AD011]
MGKKVLRTREQDNKVTVYCSDNTEYDCRILVGADGAYSAVRQNMYKTLEQQGRLPSVDKEAFSIGYITVVGVSKPNNLEKYPQLADKHRAYFPLTIGDNNDSCGLVTAPDNQISWGIQIQIPEDKTKDQRFRNSEWGPESADEMLDQFRDFPCAFGGTMKEIFDATPTDLISKVFLEEKVFQTWYNGRSVLIGDACHKLLPGAGQGAMMAMMDAVVLANCIYNMEDLSDESTNAAFASYYRQRYSEAENITKTSSMLSKMMFGHKWSDRLIRKVILNFLPGWVKMKMAEETLTKTRLDPCSIRGSNSNRGSNPTRKFNPTDMYTIHRPDCATRSDTD